VAEGRRLSRAAALDRLIARHLDAAIFGTPRGLCRLFNVPPAELAVCVGGLVRRGRVLETAVEGWPGRWLVAAAALR
jgi:hypothetical protein